VMSVGNLMGRVEEGDRFEHLQAIPRELPHLRSLLVREKPALAKDHVSKAQLTEVVQ
jgi:hypothetical protein